MEWWLALMFIFGGMLTLMATGLPLAFSLLGMILVGTYFFWGGTAGLKVLSLTMFASLANYNLVTVVMFIFMGETILQTGIGFSLMDTLDKWIGRVRARLSLVAIASGTTLSVLTGTSMATTGLLGSTLLPEMINRGYKKPVTMGPIMASACLATLIPPSAMAVILAYVAQVSVAKVLMGGILPGLIMAALYVGYIIVRSIIQPDLAPIHDAPYSPLSDKIKDSIIYILPLGLIVFLVTGTIMMGLATPSEASATGALSCLLLSMVYRKLSIEILKRILIRTTRLLVMCFSIITTSIAFSQMLAFSGAGRGLVNLTKEIAVGPLILVVIMILILIFLGMFIDSVGIVMITVPIFFPMVIAMGYDPIWFAIIFMVTLEMAPMTPPYGMAMFIMRTVAPSGYTTMMEIYKSTIPFILLNMAVLFLLLLFPDLALWLPGKM